MTTTVDTTTPSFQIKVPEAQIDDLRRRIEATRWPAEELVPDRSQGVQRTMLLELARYWAGEHDWRRCEARLNALPQFTTEIDGVEIHFIHVRSRHEDALPLIMTHGWPGSVVELLDTIGPLTDPTAHGGSPQDAFHLVLPSLPGYGFSGAPTELGWDSGRIARAWATLMERLGYPRYVAQGGDVGAAVTDAMGRQAPDGLAGIHVTLLAGALGIVGQLPATTEEERLAHAALATFTADGFGYFLEQSTRPQTIGYSLLDSPVGLAAWLLDHDTDSYSKIARAFVDGRGRRQPDPGEHPRQHHAVLADRHRRLGRPVVLGVRAGRGRGAVRQAQLLHRWASRSASRRSPVRSGPPRAAGPRPSTPASPTSTPSTAAATSPPGRSQSSSPPSCERRSAHCADATCLERQAAKEGTPRAWRPAGVRAAATRLPTMPKVVAAIRPMPTRWWAALWSQQYRPPRRRSGAAPSTSSAPPASTARRIARSRPLRVLVVSTLVLLRLVAMVAPGRCSPIALRTTSPPPLAGGLARVPGRTPLGRR